MSELGLVALALAALGVAGSVVPLVPGPLLSGAGVLTYWWSTGTAEPSPALLVVLLAVAALALVADYAGGAIAARAGGAPATTGVAAAVVGIVLFVALGPIGLLVGLVGTVFALEVRRHGDPAAGLRTALVAAVGALASAVVQVVLTGTVLVALLALALT